MKNQATPLKPLSSNISGEALILLEFNELVDFINSSDEEILKIAQKKPLIFKQLLASLMRQINIIQYEWRFKYIYPDFENPLSSIFYPSKTQGLYRILYLLDKFNQITGKTSESDKLVSAVWKDIFILIETVSKITGIKEVKLVADNKDQIANRVIDLFFLIRNEETKRLLKAADKFPELRLSSMLSESGQYLQHGEDFIPQLEYQVLMDTNLSIKQSPIGQSYIDYLEQKNMIPHCLISSLCEIIFDVWMSTPFYKGAHEFDSEYTGISIKLSTTGKTFDLYHNLVRFITTPFNEMKADVGLRSTISGLLVTFNEALYNISDEREVFRLAQQITAIREYTTAWAMFVSDEKREAMRPSVDELKRCFDDVQYVLWKMEKKSAQNQRNKPNTHKSPTLNKEITLNTDVKEIKEIVLATLNWVSDGKQGAPLHDGRQASLIRREMVCKGFEMVRDEHVSAAKAAEEMVYLYSGRQGAYSIQEKDSLRTQIARKMKKEGLSRTK